MDVIINGTAGAKADEDLCQRLAAVFREYGTEARVLLADNGAKIVELAERAAQGDSAAVVAGGGDGTINAVASALVGTDKTLGVLPLGTLNHFAKDLRIPLDVKEAVRIIAAGHAVKVDVGEVNGRVFLNNSGLGLYPSIVGLREQRQRQGWNKWLALFRAALLALRRYPFLNVRLYANGQAFAARTMFVFIGNNEYTMEGLNIGTRTCLNAGRLSLYMAQQVGRLGLLLLALRALFGRLRGAEDFLALNTEEVWVETRRRRMRVATDGEITAMDMPLHYQIRPAALSVFAPAESSAQE